MAITTKESILKVLTAYNPWWKTGSINPKMTKTYKRFAYYGVHNTKSGKNLLRIPAYAFLYLLGNAEKHGYRAIEQ